MMSALLMFLLFVSFAGAQIAVEESILTDSVDVFSKDAPSVSSRAGVALAATLLLPGAGHRYLGRSGRALTYLSIEAAALFAAVACQRTSRRVFDDARAFAWKYAGVEGGPLADESFAQNLAYAQTSEDYNRIMEYNRTVERKYDDPLLQWSWPDEALMQEYARKREWATKLHVASTFLVGALVLNRVVSFVDIRASTRYRALHALEIDAIAPAVSSDFSVAGLQVLVSLRQR